MASCLECGKLIKPKKWICESCESKAIHQWIKLPREEKEKLLKVDRKGEK